MQENFPEALRLVLVHEGGFVNHPRDPGGATNQGITLATFRMFYGRDRTVRDLQGILPTQVAYMYKIGYWEPCKCGHLPAGVDYVVFDQAVHSGPGQSAKWLQRAVGAIQDGAIGPLTLQAVSQVSSGEIIEAMCVSRLAFLRGLRQGVLWRTFGKGWERRVTEVRQDGLRLAQPLPPQGA